MYSYMSPFSSPSNNLMSFSTFRVQQIGLQLPMALIAELRPWASLPQPRVLPRLDIETRNLMLSDAVCFKLL